MRSVPYRVFAYAAAEGVKLRIDGTEVQVRRPRASRPGRRAFVSGKKQNTIKPTAISDAAAAGCCGPARCARAGCITPQQAHQHSTQQTGPPH